MGGPPRAGPDTNLGLPVAAQLIHIKPLRPAAHAGKLVAGGLICIKRATIMADGSQITADDLGLPSTVAASEDAVLDLRTVRDEAERKAVIAALARSNGNVLKAAEMLGVSRPTLYDLLKQYRMQS